MATTELDAETIDRLRAALTRISRRIDRQVVRRRADQHAAVGARARSRRAGRSGSASWPSSRGVNPTMLSRIVGKLEEAGLIQRQVDADDRRAVRVEVTAGRGHGCASGVLAERSRLLAERLAGCRTTRSPQVDRRDPGARSARRRAGASARRPRAHDRAQGARPADLLVAGATRTTGATSPGQSTSLIGTWMQTVAQSWLVLHADPLGHPGRPRRRGADPAGPAARPLRRRRRRPRRQAPADDRAADADGRAGARRSAC